MNERYRVGISGSGFGVRVHLPALLAHPRFDVVALASPNSAAAVAAERKIPHAFASCEEMVAGAQLDAVVVASPPFVHRADVLASLERGLHVLCEKPFALNLEQAEDMLAASKRAGTACGMSHEFRWIPQRTAVKELVVNGHLKPLREIEVTYLTTFLRESGTRKRGWWFEKRYGGGMAGAIGSHMIDLASWIAGRPPIGSMGLIRTANPQRHDDGGSFTSDVDDGMFAVIDYGDGLVARVSVDGTCAVDQLSIAAHAENRTAVASGTSLVEARLFSIDAEETNELQCKPSPHAKFASLGAPIPYLMDLYDAWIRAMDGGDASDLPNFTEAVATQRVLDTVGFRTP